MASLLRNEDYPRFEFDAELINETDPRITIDHLFISPPRPPRGELPEFTVPIVYEPINETDLRAYKMDLLMTQPETVTEDETDLRASRMDLLMTPQSQTNREVHYRNRQDAMAAASKMYQPRQERIQQLYGMMTNKDEHTIGFYF